MPTFPCPPPFDQYYCHNKGRCLADSTSEGGFAPFCQCQINFSGPRCQNTYNSNVYGFATVGLDAPVQQYILLSLMFLAFFVVCIGFIWYVWRNRGLEENDTVTFVNSRPLFPDGTVQTSRSSLWTP